MRLSVLVLAGCAIGGEPGATCGPTSATVDRVIDGDTIVLATGVHLRYVLVDTPEVGTCYAAEATAFDRALVDGAALELAYDVECEDRYHRTLAYVTANGVDVNRELVARGYARVLHIPPNGNARAAEFSALEAAARREQVGLWGACR